MLKYNINRVDFVLLEQLVLVQQPYKAGMPWQFAGSFYYATTVLTTIGKIEPDSFLTAGKLWHFLPTPPGMTYNHKSM